MAEVLLQQTRVEQAIPYYERFIARFPDLAALARAEREEVLKVWEGAGYYARAHRLHESARRLQRAHRGQLPRTRDELAKLPGFGPYISAAVASLAFGEPVAALEANARRVVTRWHLARNGTSSPRDRRRLEELVLRDLPRARPGEFNEALMELGETTCLPRAPHCTECPVAQWCRARNELPDPGSIPAPARRTDRPHQRAAVVVLESEGRWLVQRRPPVGLLGGLWEFPGGKIREGEVPLDAARRELREETGAVAGELIPVGIVEHAYSHFTLELHLFRGTPAPGSPSPRLSVNRRWLTPEEFARRPRPRATERAVALLPASGGLGKTI